MPRNTLKDFSFIPNDTQEKPRAISDFASSHRPFKRRHRWTLLGLTTLLLVHLLSPAANAQLRITVLEKNQKKLNPPTLEVSRILEENRQSLLIGTVPMNVEIGDELIGVTGAVTVKVRCNNSAELALSGRFRIRFLRATARECNLHFQGTGKASMIVNASGPTNVQSGEIRLASSRTRYEIRTAEGGILDALKLATEILVYEDAVVTTSTGSSKVVKVEEGEKLAAKGISAPTIQKLKKEDLRRAAETYARLDVSQISNVRDLIAAYSKLVGLHLGVLASPHDQTKLMALITAQREFSIADPSSVLEPTTPGVKEYKVNSGASLVQQFSMGNGCKSPIIMRLTLNNAPFARLVSSAEGAILAGGQKAWTIQFDATGLKPGVYVVELEFTCVDCAVKQCSLVHQVTQVKFVVQ
jgi:hypothetical protein